MKGRGDEWDWGAWWEIHKELIKYYIKITLKCDPLLAELYRKQYEDVVVRGYHCPPVQAIYRNTVYINKTVSDELIFEMIDHSYNEVIKSFSKKIQKQLLEN